MGWSDVAGKLIEFLKTPSGLGVFALALIAGLIIFLTPIGVLTWFNIIGTDRIVSAIHELKDTITAQRIALK